MQQGCINKYFRITLRKIESVKDYLTIITKKSLDIYREISMKIF